MGEPVSRAFGGTNAGSAALKLVNNGAVTTLTTIPAYLVNRRWVWAQARSTRSTRWWRLVETG